MPTVYGQKSKPQTCDLCGEPGLSLLLESNVGMVCPECKEHLEALEKLDAAAEKIAKEKG
jgi:hypothetical protein